LDIAKDLLTRFGAQMQVCTSIAVAIELNRSESLDQSPNYIKHRILLVVLTLLRLVFVLVSALVHLFSHTQIHIPSLPLRLDTRTHPQSEHESLLRLILLPLLDAPKVDVRKRACVTLGALMPALHDRHFKALMDLLIGKIAAVAEQKQEPQQKQEQQQQVLFTYIQTIGVIWYVSLFPRRVSRLLYFVCHNHMFLFPHFNFYQFWHSCMLAYFVICMIFYAWFHVHGILPPTHPHPTLPGTVALPAFASGATCRKSCRCSIASAPLRPLAPTQSSSSSSSSNRPRCPTRR
jgi:hypothetical protein